MSLYSVEMSRVGRDQRVDSTIAVTASGPLDASLKAEKKWRDDGNLGRFYTVSVREVSTRFDGDHTPAEFEKARRMEDAAQRVDS